MTENDPKEFLKKALLIGIGATALTFEKVQEFANELVAKGELSQKEATSFTEDLKKRAVKEKVQFEFKVKEMVDSYLKSAVKSLGLVTKAEVKTAKPKTKAKTPKKPAAKKAAPKKSSAKPKSSATKTTAKKAKPAAKKTK